LEAERTLVLEAVGQWVGKMLDDEREERKRALSLEARELRVQLVELRAVLGEYRAALATAGDRRSALDLPNPLSARTTRVN
jgi:hypothetical protein